MVTIDVTYVVRLVCFVDHTIPYKRSFFFYYFIFDFIKIATWAFLKLALSIYIYKEELSLTALWLSFYWVVLSILSVLAQCRIFRINDFADIFNY